ncbi:YtzH-like family protein [Halalkalibacterium ligniniphilum]|uniref:YtzH-like family protein n=1 Tax=Halalkalibacterium ligniniphilum TaxID=1134413 RepID=UPI000346A64C|nr:YtzH-like family protein [Halalkalibacterium ligniniphilum]
MPITNREKVRLLKDLLQNQATEQYMSLDEAAQIERITSSILQDQTLPIDLQHTIRSIQTKHTQNTSPFSNDDVEQWLSVLTEQ